MLSGLLLFSTRAQQQTADSLDYALSARTGLGMYHPHHLLFIPIVRLCLSVIQTLLNASDPILAGQIHGIFWAMVTVSCIFLVARRLLSSVAHGFLVALFLLVSRGFWLYSTQLEVYVPATGCLAAITVLLLARPRSLPGQGLGLLLSLLLALSILYHQSNIFFCIPLGYWLVRGQGQRSWRGLWVLLLSEVLVLSAYLLAFRYSDVEFRISEILSPEHRFTFVGFIRFCLAYGFHPSPGWGTWHNLSVMGVGRLIHSQIRDFLTFPWSLRFLVIPGFGLLMAALVFWHALRSARGAPDAPARRFLLIWLVTYDVFFLWWFPGEKEFFITLLYPLILLAALAVKDLSSIFPMRAAGRALIRGGCLVLLGGIAAINTVQTILPYHRDRGPAYAAASALAARVPGCLVIGDYSVGQNLRYYFGRERFIEAAMPLFYLYQDIRLPDRYGLEGETCVVADLSFVSPGYSLGGFDARNHPKEWARYAAWLLGLEHDPRRGGLSCRRFEGVGEIEGSPYVRLSGEHEPVESVREVFRRLDAEIAAGGGGDRPFETWLNAAPPSSLPWTAGGAP